MVEKGVGEELSEGAKVLLQQFAISFFKTRKITAVPLEKIKAFLERAGYVDYEDIVKELESRDIIKKGAKGYYLTKYGWKVAEEIWGKGLERLVPIGV